MDFESLPDVVHLKWTSLGELVCRAESVSVAASARLALSPLGPRGAGVSNLGPLDRTQSSFAKIRAIREWCIDRGQAQRQDHILMQLNAAQLRERSELRSLEEDQWRGLMSSFYTTRNLYETVRVLSSEEVLKRSNIEKEVEDFMNFALAKEPVWRQMASNKAHLRQFSDNALNSLRSTYSDEFKCLVDIMFAISLQEKEYRDMAFARQLRREEQANDAKLAMEYEKERLRQERENEERRIANLNASRQRQQQQNNQFGNTNSTNFAMPPQNIYGAVSSNYNYNHGPSAGNYYGSR